MRQDIRTLDGKAYDVAIIGAGINGSSTAALLASQGYQVLLVDKGDFGGGSSGRSSRLLHCGLLYLSMAKAARSWRQKLANLAMARKMMGFRRAAAAQVPARVRGETFFVPIFRQNPISLWQFDAAMAVLRALDPGGPPLDYRRYRGASLRSHPVLSHFGPDLVGAVSFTDYVYDWPERICVDYALQAEASGATIRNYTRAAAGRQVEDGWSLSLEDAFPASGRADVRARMVLNLTGVWADDLASHLRQPGPRTVTPNKGCHLMVRLPPEFTGSGIVCQNAIGHLFICVPWRGLHILGPTETVYSGHPDDVAVQAEDVTTILALANELLPRLRLTEDDVVARWAGLRPATFEENNPRGAWHRMIHDMSERDASPLLSLSWGRLADHQLSAAELVRAVNRRLAPSSAPGHAAGARKLGTAGETAHATTVADVMFRRTGRGWDPDLGMGSVDEVAQALAAADPATDASVLAADYRRYLAREFGCRSS